MAVRRPGPRKKQRGRPLANTYAPKVDATPEEIARAMFALPADHEWQYEKGRGKVYACEQCGKQVAYPETLHRDGRCESCHDTPVS